MGNNSISKQMTDNEQFTHFLLKVKERIIIIFDHNIPNGKPLIESDVEFLYVMYKLYYNGDLEKLSKEPLSSESAKQPELFTTTLEAPILPFTEEPTDSLSRETISKVMIHKDVHRLYKAGVKNKEFNKHFKKADSEYYVPGIFISDMKKAAYALVYEGWLIARWQFNESDYKP